MKTKLVKETIERTLNELQEKVENTVSIESCKYAIHKNKER